MIYIFTKLSGYSQEFGEVGLGEPPGSILLPTPNSSWAQSQWKGTKGGLEEEEAVVMYPQSS